MFGSMRPTVSVLRLIGPIGQVGPLRSGMTLRSLAGLIDRAFKPRNLKAVALVINSPGGSPVQSSLIQQRIRSIAMRKGVPVLVFVEDVAASGGYWLACAGDEIFVNENSIVGSIGVIAAGFGFPEALDRIGVERRIYTAGEHKGMLDPFRPEDPRDVERLKAIQGEMHENFKGLVRSRRGKRLKAPESELFTGEFWTGRRAVDLGLVDAVGDLRSVVRDRFGDKVRFQVAEPRRGWLRRRLGMSARAPDGDHALGAGIGAGLLAAVEERLMWSRWGL
jgi:serine protease SohB